MSIMLSSRLNYRAARHDGLPKRLLELRLAEIGDSEIEPPLRLQKFTPAMFDSVP
jgi:hypothetical protein